MLKDRLAGVKSLRAPSPFGQEVEAVLSVGVEADGKHDSNLASLYTYNKSNIQVEQCPRFRDSIQGRKNLPDLAEASPGGLPRVPPRMHDLRCLTGRNLVSDRPSTIDLGDGLEQERTLEKR